MGITMDPGPTLLPKKLLKDYEKGTLDEQGMKDLLLTLTKEQLKTLYDFVLEELDPFGPDDKLTDLLDWLDPDYTYFQ